MPSRTTRRHALGLLATAPLLATGARPAAAAPSLELEPPSIRTIPLTGGDLVRTLRVHARFSMVGLAWEHGPAPEVAEVRVLRDGAWGGWMGLVAAEGGAGSATEPVWTGRARAVQVRALRDGAAARGLSVILVDTGSSLLDEILNRLPLPGRGSGDRSAGELEVIRRSQWGAGRSCSPDFAPPVRAIAVHHTAGSNDYGPGDSAAIVRGIWVYHARTQGWCDIGYHALVDRFGRIFEGRAGGLNRAVVGAHAGGFNLHTSSIAMIGSFGRVHPPAAMQRSLVRFLGYQIRRHDLDPHGHTTLTSQGGGTSRYAPGRRVRLPVIFGHRDTGATACPGDAGYALLSQFRDRAASGSSPGPTLPDLPGPLSRVTGS